MCSSLGGWFCVGGSASSREKPELNEMNETQARGLLRTLTSGKVLAESATSSSSNSASASSSDELPELHEVRDAGTERRTLRRSRTTKLAEKIYKPKSHHKGKRKDRKEHCACDTKALESCFAPDLAEFENSEEYNQRVKLFIKQEKTSEAYNQRQGQAHQGWGHVILSTKVIAWDPLQSWQPEDVQLKEVKYLMMRLHGEGALAVYRDDQASSDDDGAPCLRLWLVGNIDVYMVEYNVIKIHDRVGDYNYCYKLIDGVNGETFYPVNAWIEEIRNSKKKHPLAGMPSYVGTGAI